MDSSTVGIPLNDPEGYRLAVDYAVRISSHGLYVHSAPWAVPSMGVENVSHGCISLSPADAEWYFNNVKIGERIPIHDCANKDFGVGMFRDSGADQSVVTVVLGKPAPPPAPRLQCHRRLFKGLSP